MAVLEHEVRSATDFVTGLRRHLYTRDEYYTLAEAGVFRDQRIELIEGEIIDMAPVSDPHAAVTHPIARILETAFGMGFTLRSQVPIALGDARRPSDPLPDVAVVTGSWRDYVARKPGPADVKLVVEISDSSLNDDRKIKAALYADAGIPEYWIVNLVDRQLEVYREPLESGYASVTIYRLTDTVEPLHAPGKPLAIVDFMP